MKTFIEYLFFFCVKKIATGVVIEEEGASEAIGTGGAIAEHDATVSVSGDHEVPALVSLSTGSGVGLYQSASNYQQSQINTDGSSNAYQANSASNSGYGSDFLYGDAQGLNVDVQSNGWSAVEGDGAVGQVDTLNHQGPVVAPHPTQSGWRRP